MPLSSKFRVIACYCAMQCVIHSIKPEIHTEESLENATAAGLMLFILRELLRVASNLLKSLSKQIYIGLKYLLADQIKV